MSVDVFSRLWRQTRHENADGSRVKFRKVSFIKCLDGFR